MARKKIFNGFSLDEIRKRVHNALDGEGKMAELKAALDELFTKMEEAEVEYTFDDFKAEIMKLWDANKAEQSKEVAEKIAKRFQALQDSLTPKAKELPAKIKNEICAAVLKCAKKEEVENSVNAVLAKNGISGLSFNEAIDYTIVDGWGNGNRLFSLLKKVPFSKFFYTSQDLDNASTLAKQWSKSAEGQKVIQSVTANGKTITTQYVYKRQQLAREDLDEIEQNAPTLLKWLNEELDRVIVQSIIMAILVGDTTNDVGKRITCFETIKKDSTDAWTTVSTAAAATVTFAECRAAADAVKNPNGLLKIGIMSPATKTILSRFKYASGGDDAYRSDEELAAQLGVDEIVVSDFMSGKGAEFICMLPDEYWVREKNAIAVTYPTYEENVINYQKERNVGGQIHGLLSTAVVKTHV